MSINAPAAPRLVEAPYLTRPVMDEAGLVSERDREIVEANLVDLKRATGIHMAVYVPRSLGDLDIETFSIEVAEQWKLGKKGEDRGLLLVVAPRERRMRLEVGYGLEGQITDAVSRRILDEVLRPYLRDRRPGDGLIAVAQAVAGATGSEWRPSGTVRPPRQKTRGSPLVALLVFLPVLLIFFLALGRRGAMVVRGRYYRPGRRGWSPEPQRSSWGAGSSRSWGGSSGGFGGGGASWGGGSGGFGGGGTGGFGGGGTGGFGGGGASSSW